MQREDMERREEGRVYGDPDHVRVLARRAAGMADHLRDEAVEAAALREVGWQSTGADRWRDRLDEHPSPPALTAWPAVWKGRPVDGATRR